MLDEPREKLSVELIYQPSWRQPRQKVRLIWDSDDIVRLASTTESGAELIIVKTPVMRIQKFAVFQGTLRLHIDNVTYNLTEIGWERGTHIGASFGGPIGLLIAARSERASALKAWIEPLRLKQVPVQYRGVGWLLRISFLLAACIIVGLLAVLFVK